MRHFWNYGREEMCIRDRDELDKGVIQGLCITDDFSAGYLSVKAAVELINGRFDGNGDYQNYQEGSCIGRKELKAGTYETVSYTHLDVYKRQEGIPG